MDRNNDTLDVMLGAFVVDLLHRDDITELYVNDDGYVRYQSQEEGKVKTEHYISPEKNQAIIELVAGQVGKIVNEEIPSISAEIRGYEARFEGEIYPIVRKPQWNWRKKAVKIFTLEEYVKNGVLSEKHKKYIEEAIAKRKNIIVTGGTGTGKTTFLNAILAKIAQISPYHRIISIEDLPELQCPADDYSPMFTTQEVGTKGIKYDATRILSLCMRRSPDRIVVGEVKDGSAYVMLKTWNTGHEGGGGTVHSNGAEEALTRIKSLAQENPDAAGDLKELIGGAVDVIIAISHVELDDGKRSRIVNEILEVNGYDSSTDTYNLKNIDRN